MFRPIIRTFSTKTPANWVVAKYTPTDAHRIRAIALPVLHDLVSVPHTYTAKQKENLYQTDVQKALDDPTFTTQVIAQKDKQIGGFITYHLSNRCLVGPTGVIEHLAIDPQHRKQGLGTTLLNHAVTDLKEQGARAVLLRITSDQIAPFYQRNGFNILRYPDFRFQSAGSMGKILNPSNHWLTDSLALSEKSSVWTQLAYAIGLIAFVILTDNKSNSETDPKTSH